MAPHPTASSPLVGDHNTSATATTKCSSWASGLIYTLAGSRVALGASALLAPQLTCRLFGVETLPGSSLLTRIFGVREAAVGLVTVVTCSNYESKRELRRLLWTGVGIDAMDVIACLIILASSDTTEAAAAKTTACVGLGAVLLGLFTIKSVN